MIRGFIASTIDGYIADLDGSTAFLGPYENEPAGYETFLEAIRTLVMGRKTFEACLGFGEWPYPGRRTIVVTSSPLGDMPPDVEIWPHDLAALISHLRTKAGQDVWVVGGGKLQQAFLDAGALDRLDLFVVPVLLGTGVPLFPVSRHRQTLRLAAVGRHGELAHLTYERQE
jgi:dihydrofolate reductase